MLIYYIIIYRKAKVNYIFLILIKSLQKDVKTLKIPHRKKDMRLPIMFAISLLLCFICFASHSSGTSTLLSKGLSIVTTPLRAVAKGTYNAASSVGTYFTDINKLKKENERLTKQNKALSEENAEYQALKDENDSLYKFLDLKKERTDYKFTNANIVSKASSGYLSIFTIDKGSFHGIKENMPIISDEGALLGVTYSVEGSSTRCKSVLSYDMNVGVYDKETGATGILSGSFDTFSQSRCVMKALPNESSLALGSKIYTSGLGEVYPRDLFIGTVYGFIPEQGSHTKNAVIALDDSIITSDSIMVITSFERVYE